MTTSYYEFSSRCTLTYISFVAKIVAVHQALAEGTRLGKIN
jgi:hypothetical protein